MSETPFSFSEIVRDWAGEPAGPTGRSALALRLTAAASVPWERDIGALEADGLDEGSWPETPERSRPIANWAAPEISTKAIAPDIPVVSRDISCPAVTSFGPSTRSEPQRLLEIGDASGKNVTVKKIEKK